MNWLFRKGRFRYCVSLLVVAIFFISFQFMSAKGNDNHPKYILLRLEDVGPGGQYGNMEQLGKLRAVLDFLQQNEAGFQIGVISRWINLPQDGTVYDRTLSEQDDPYSAAFLSLVRQAERSGNVIGMHGYTHQVGSVRREDGHHESGVGNEFKVSGVQETSTVEYADLRVKEALAVFKQADIHPRFWEAPHYRTTPEQDAVFRSYFGLHYQGNVNVNPYPKQVQYLAERNIGYGQPSLGAVYVPTPFSYIPYNKDANIILQQLDKTDGLPSFFYHPFLEFKHLLPVLDSEGNHVVQDGLPLFQYPDKARSHLQKLLPKIKEKGYSFITLDDFIPFTPAHSMDIGTQQDANFAVGDVTGDRQADVVRWDSAKGTVWVQPGNFRGMRNDPQPEPAEWARLYFHKGSVFTLLDANADNLMDLCTVQADGRVEIYISDGHRFSFHQAWQTGIAGWIDIYALRQGDGGWIFAGQSRNRKQLEAFYLTKDLLQPIDSKPFSPKIPYTLQVVDIEGDGRQSFIIPMRRTGRLLRLSADINMLKWETATSALGIPTGYRGDMRIGDFNGDDKQDVLFWDLTRNKYILYQQDETLKFNFLAEMGPWSKNRQQLLIYDFDGNGKQDIALFGADDPYLDIALSYQK